MTWRTNVGVANLIRPFIKQKEITLATRNVKRGPTEASTTVQQTTRVTHVSADVESLMLAALEGGRDGATTGRYIMTFKEGATDAGMKALPVNVTVVVGAP